jgi:hypothetical protein
MDQREKACRARPSGIVEFRISKKILSPESMERGRKSDLERRGRAENGKGNVETLLGLVFALSNP